MAGPCGFDRELALRIINDIRPGIRIFETSTKTGAGMDAWLGHLAQELAVRGRGAVSFCCLFRRNVPN